MRQHVLDCFANKALITGVNPVVSAFFIVLQAWPSGSAVSTLSNAMWTRMGPF